MTEGASTVRSALRIPGFLALILVVLALPSVAVMLLKPDAQIRQLQTQIDEAEEDIAVAAAVERKRSQFLEQVNELRAETERIQQSYFLEGDANDPIRDGVRAWLESALGVPLSGDNVTIARELWRGNAKGPAGEGSFEFVGVEAKVALPALTLQDLEGVQRSLEAGVESWHAVPIREVDMTRDTDDRYKVEATLVIRVRYAVP